MENIKIPVSSKNILEPAHEGDAGHDLIAYSGPIFSGKPLDEDQNYWRLLRYIEYETQVAMAPPPGVYTLVFPRSSITSNTNLTLGNCVAVIDQGYRNTIKLRFRYHPQPEDYELVGDRLYMSVNKERIYQQGDKIGQAVFVKMLPTELELRNALSDQTSRGQGGFGSTGR